VSEENKTNKQSHQPRSEKAKSNSTADGFSHANQSHYCAGRAQKGVIRTEQSEIADRCCPLHQSRLLQNTGHKKEVASTQPRKNFSVCTCNFFFSTPFS